MNTASFIESITPNRTFNPQVHSKSEKYHYFMVDIFLLLFTIKKYIKKKKKTKLKHYLTNLLI